MSEADDVVRTSFQEYGTEKIDDSTTLPDKGEITVTLTENAFRHVRGNKITVYAKGTTRSVIRRSVKESPLDVLRSHWFSDTDVYYAICLHPGENNTITHSKINNVQDLSTSHPNGLLLSQCLEKMTLNSFFHDRGLYLALREDILIGFDRSEDTVQGEIGNTTYKKDGVAFLHPHYQLLSQT